MALEAFMKLLFLTGKHAGRKEPLVPMGTVIGRAADCPIILEDDGVSRHHCRLSRIEGQWFVEDLGSLNGVIVNGAKTNGVHGLRPGDRFTIVNTELELVDDEAAKPMLPTTETIAPPPAAVPPLPPEISRKPPPAAAGDVPMFVAAEPPPEIVAAASQKSLKARMPAMTAAHLPAQEPPRAGTTSARMAEVPPIASLPPAAGTAHHAASQRNGSKGIPWVRLLLLAIVLLLIGILVSLLRPPPAIGDGTQNPDAGNSVWTAQPTGRENGRYLVIPVPAGATVKFIPEGKPGEAIPVAADYGRVQSLQAVKGRLEIVPAGNADPISVELDPATAVLPPKKPAP